MAGDRWKLPAQQPEAASEEDEHAAATLPRFTSVTSTCGTPTGAHHSHTNLSGRSGERVPRTATLGHTSPAPRQRHEPELDGLHHGWLACKLAAALGIQGFT